MMQSHGFVVASSWLLVRVAIFAIVIMTSFITVLLFPHATSAVSKVTQVATGYSHACAVVNFKVQCWGDNASGQLGTGRKNTTPVTKPQAVVQNKESVAETKKCGSSLFGNCISWVTDTPYSPASPLAGKSVTKVSAGYNHTCAIASAAVYCWGDNSRGQLGNRSTTSSSVPVIVDTKVAWTEVNPAHCDGSSNWLTGCAAPTGTWVPEKRIEHPASALARKEIIDITAAEYYTCALASDGSVACWGEGANGRLGTNSTADKNVPTAVYAQGDLNTKKGVRLARAGSAAMCVLAVAANDTKASSMGSPYCWGQGMGDGVILETATDKSSTKYSASSCAPTHVNTTQSRSYFDAVAPRSYGLREFSSVDTAIYATGIAVDQKAYYWGGNGYIKTVKKTTTCEKGDKKGLNHCSGGGHGGGTPTGGGSATPGCTSSVTETTVAVATYERAGKLTATGPLYTDGTLGQKTFKVASGDAYDGLFCAVTNNGAYCDLKNDTNVGQTGSNYAQTCGWRKLRYVCSDDPVGPQAVYPNGWLAGKTITRISTSIGGYTCAIASGVVGCWGVNDKGQLGVGDKTNRSTPTGVEL